MSFVDLAKYTKTDILAPYLVLKERCKILQKNEGEGRYIIEVFTNHGRFVLKICDIELKKYKADPTVYQQRRSAILLEADNMARFSKYNHFVKIIRKVQNKKSLELLMEYCGKSLIDKIKDDGSVLSQYNLVSWMSQTIIGMRYLEKNRMHHGDIKPENLLILDDHINITDLGESSEIESGFERTLRIGKKTVLKGYTEAYAP
jgi:serine/threonine protein kinase